MSDEALAQLGAMGFSMLESRRALRMCGQDVHRAVEFTMEEKRKKVEQKENDRRVRRELRQAVGMVCQFCPVYCLLLCDLKIFLHE